MKLIGKGDALLAFYEAKQIVQSVAKSEEADMGRFQVRYASLNAVHAECERACEIHRLVVVQEPTIRGDLFAVLNTLIHADGSMIEMEPMCLPLPREAQALGSATTYLRRYSLVAQFGLAVTDDDGAEATKAAQTGPGRRTEAERMIRESVGQMDDATRKAFVAAFKEQFKVALADLPANRHGEALAWAKQWQAPGDAADAEWIQKAQEETTT